VAAPTPPRTAPAPVEVNNNRATPPGNDPLGDLARARAGIAPAPAANPAPAAVNDPFLYFVQAGAFRAPEDAEAQRAKLSLVGVEAKVTEREQAGRTVYRVRAGPFNQKEEADRLKARLDGNGLESTLVRVQR
jgi:cell division protein FtsN